MAAEVIYTIIKFPRIVLLKKDIRLVEKYGKTYADSK